MRMLRMRRWFADVRIRQVTEIVVEPHCTRGDVYNLWPGYVAERLPPVPDADVAALVAPFVRHLHEVITCENQAHTDWFLDYLANVVQRPQQPTHVAVSIFGKQGCGKGLLFTFLRERVLGPDVTFQTAHPENDLLGRFQNGTVARVFIQVRALRALHGVVHSRTQRCAL